MNTLQDKIDNIRFEWVHDDLWIYTDVEKAVNKAIQELREEINHMRFGRPFNDVSTERHRIIDEVLSLIGEKK